MHIHTCTYTHAHIRTRTRTPRGCSSLARCFSFFFFLSFCLCLFLSYSPSLKASHGLNNLQLLTFNLPCFLLLSPSPSSAFEEPIPDDRYHGIYFAMLLAGVGFLLPYNSFITDVDYLHHKFQGSRNTHNNEANPAQILPGVSQQ